MELSTKVIGARGELLVAEEFLRRGFAVYTPLVDSGADLVADVNGRLLRIQVKSYDGDDDTHTFKLLRRNPRGTGWSEYDENSIDWYALVYLRRGYIALTPANGKKKTFVSFKPQSETVREEMEIGRVLDRLQEE